MAEVLDHLPTAILTLSEDYVQMQKDLADVTKQVQVLTQQLKTSQHVERAGSKRLREVEVVVSEHEEVPGAGEFI